MVKGIGHNAFRKFDRLKTAGDRFVVTPNNLTIDAYAIVDVADGPVVLHVPRLKTDRWFIVQVGDAFDDVVHNVGGSRTPMPGPYLLTGPDHRGEVPGDMIQVKLRTNIGFAAVRIAVTGSADQAGAVEAQRGFTMRPLPDYLKFGIAGAEVAYGPIAFSALTAPEDLVHFDRLGSAMKYMLSARADVNDTFVPTLGTIGLSVRKGFDWRALDEATLAGLRRAAPMIEQIADERWCTMSETVNGWRGSLASGRCSYDWALNAANTKNQVGTEVADQVVYVNTAVDSDGQSLDGTNTYVLHFEPGQTPPVAGMWNVAMYDESMLFIANEIDRFSIGSTTDGLAENPDGSLTIHLQHAKPTDDRVSNWLPAPVGSFNLTMRYYTPLAPVLDRTYKLSGAQELILGTATSLGGRDALSPASVERTRHHLPVHQRQRHLNPGRDHSGAQVMPSGRHEREHRDRTRHGAEDHRHVARAVDDPTFFAQHRARRPRPIIDRFGKQHWVDAEPGGDKGGMASAPGPDRNQHQRGTRPAGPRTPRIRMPGKHRVPKARHCARRNIGHGNAPSAPATAVGLTVLPGLPRFLLACHDDIVTARHGRGGRPRTYPSPAGRRHG